MDVEHCRRCGQEITDTRFALARARTGDLVFCGGQCWRDWEASDMELAQRIGPVARYYLSEEYIALAATAICLRHKHGRKLAQTRPADLTDEQLAATVLRLKAWIAEQPPLAIHPDSRLARQSDAAEPDADR